LLITYSCTCSCSDTNIN